MQHIPTSTDAHSLFGTFRSMVANVAWPTLPLMARTGPTSLGDLQALDFAARPGFTFRTSGDSVLVRYPRSGLGRQLLEGVGWYLLGKSVESGVRAIR